MLRCRHPGRSVRGHRRRARRCRTVRRRRAVVMRQRAEARLYGPCHRLRQLRRRGGRAAGTRRTRGRGRAAVRARDLLRPARLRRKARAERIHLRRGRGGEGDGGGTGARPRRPSGRRRPARAGPAGRAGDDARGQHRVRRRPARRRPAPARADRDPGHLKQCRHHVMTRREGLVPRATNGSPEAGRKGRLAEVLASRGGQAAPEAPFVIEHREALIYMLCEAAELEHGIMCQYLFAAFSLKQRTDEGLSEEQLAVVTRWRKAVAHVATEEMLHLALVHNLLSAVGAAPHFGRPNLPAPAHHYPAGVNLTLVPFGEQALQHFMFLERPEGMELEGAEGIDAPIHDAIPLMAEGDIVPQLQDFATVGHLYRSIEQGLAHLSEKFGESNLFVGPSRAQASREHFQWPELVAVTDLATAQKALDTILEQGEGARGHWQQAHFGQFVQILDEYRAMCAANPEFDPVRPVMFATVRSGERDTNTPRIADPVTAKCADLFNVSYEILLQMFERYFAHTEETDAQLSTLADAAVALMLQVLRPLGGLITTLPVGDAFPGMNAGPSFELFYEDDYLMPHREAAWALLEERIRDAVTI